MTAMPRRSWSEPWQPKARAGNDWPTAFRLKRSSLRQESAVINQEGLVVSYFALAEDYGKRRRVLQIMVRKNVRLLAAVMILAALSVVVGAVQSLPMWVKSTSTRLTTADNDKYFFMRRVYEAQVKRAFTAGRMPFPDLRENPLGFVEAGHKLRKDAAEQCKLLLKQAKSDLRRQKERGSQSAIKVSDIGVYSAYRSVEHDRAAWRSAFEKHFRETKSARARLRGGEYGDEAGEMMI